MQKRQSACVSCCECPLRGFPRQEALLGLVFSKQKQTNGCLVKQATVLTYSTLFFKKVAGLFLWLLLGLNGYGFVFLIQLPPLDGFIDALFIIMILVLYFETCHIQRQPIHFLNI